MIEGAISWFNQANPFHGFIAGTGLLVYLIGCLAQYALNARQVGERISLSGLGRFLFPWDKLLTHSTRIDLFFYVVNRLSNHLLLITNVVLAVWLSHVLATWPGGGATVRPDLVALVLAYMLAFLPRDLAHYAIHRLHHEAPFLWELHKVHHASTYLTPLTTLRTHPVEDQIFAVGEGLAMGVALGLLRRHYAFGDGDLLIIIPTAYKVAQALVLVPLQHSQVRLHFGPLDRVFYSPSLHQVHHSSETHHWNKNFGECLSLWDSLFGSYRSLGSDEVTPGLTGDEHLAYRTLVACYFRPLARQARMLRGERPVGPIVSKSAFP